MKFCKCQNLNSLFLEINFLELPKYFWNLQMLIVIEKFKNWRILLKIIEKLVRLWQAKLKNEHAFWNIGIQRIWYVGT